MARRISWEDKGKARVAEHAPPRLRVKAPHLDTTSLVNKHKLTLIGRLTNPHEQRLSNMIPYLIRKWTLKGNVTGSDLGRDCFQFMFELAEDMEKVLSNRPYHYERWMLIIQRWEPIISPTFPAFIPFWIELKGIPLHYWQKYLLYSIGEELGGMIKHEITSTTAKIKVHINGLQPLVKETVIEYESGEESIVTLEYENMENHCRICHRLTHDTYNCQEERETVKEPDPRGRYAEKRYEERNEREREFHQRHDRCGKPFGDRAQPLRTRETGDLRQTLRNREEERRRQRTPTQIWRETGRRRERSPPAREDSGTPTNIHPTLERALDFTGIPVPPRVPTEEEVMADLQDVTIRYVNCGDPVESEARRQRVLQGEMEGLMANTAARIVAAATTTAQAQTPQTGPQQMPLQLLDNETAFEGESPTPVPAAKRRGRPPLVKKKLGKSPMCFKGTSLMKRKICQVQNSPRQRTAQNIQTTNTRASTSRVTTPRQQAIAGAIPDGNNTQGQRHSGNSTTAADARPSGRLPVTPANNGRVVDFQNPSHPLP
ncbi:unnamed protein product [Microthlaspi erraticum]|uniref:DUF4283 domain-containing protein n=1 Tax=Microthlaspi erraticum TaxID=1685480 RepID=A0A6D2LIY0_9BRAS|nr:unnamed protein product [Microthlaspi erraticum]